MLGQVDRFRSFGVFAFIALTVLTGAGAGLPAADAHGKPPKVTPLSGVDVSNWQGTINWSQVAAAGEKFAFMKATQGTTYLDPFYAGNHAGSRAAGLVPGAYHYADPTLGDAVAQADWFVNNAHIASNDLRPVLDFEKTNGLSAAVLTQWALDWLNEVTLKDGGRKPFVFTYYSFWSNNMANTTAIAAAGYQLWISAGAATSNPAIPASNWDGLGWAFWKYNSCGSVRGISGCVDLDRANGTSLTPYL